MSHPAYAKTKPSDVEWLGKVPTHWRINRLKNSVASARNGVWGDEPKDDKNDLICVRVADFDRQTNTIKPDKFTLRNIPLSEQKGRVLKNGDLLLEKSGGGELQPVGFVVSFEYAHPAVCSNFVARLELSRKVDSRYFCYVHSAAYAIRLNSRSIKQTTGIQNLDEDAYLNEAAPFPPLPEQQQIAAFLDRKTAELDAVLRLKERQLELLAEKRQALISQAVTRGLDPTAPLKPSGIPRLGDVPEHWEVKRLRYMCLINPPKSEVNSLPPDTLVSFLPMDKVGTEGEMLLDESRAIEDVMQGFTYFRDRDVILAKITPCFENGKGALVNNLFNGIGFGSTEFHVLRAQQSILPDYLYLITKSAPFRSIGTGSMYGAGGQKRVPEDFLADFEFAVPPLEEQRAIVAYLDSETARMDGIAHAIRTQIGKVREYRQALISAAVTGKIDVRGNKSET